MVKKFVQVSILLLTMSSLNSWAGLPQTDRSLPEYVLSHAEILELDIKQKVEYFKFLVQYLGAIEKMQPNAHKNESAALQLRLLDLMPTAHAEDSAANYSGNKRDGQTCIFGLEASKYVSNSSGGYFCQPVFGTGTCPSGEKACPDKLAQIAQLAPNGASSSSLCVKASVIYAKENGFSLTCAKKLSEVVGSELNLDQAIAAQMEKWTVEKQKSYESFVNSMKSHLTDLQNQSFGSNKVTVREYCSLAKNKPSRGSNRINADKQKEECQTLLKLVDSFDAAVVETEREPDAPSIHVEEKAEAAAVVESQGEPDDTATTEAVDTRTAKTTKPPKEKPPKPAAKTKPVVQDCLAKHEPALGALACVACGLEKARNAKVTTYNNYIALLGAMAQVNGDYSTSTANGRGQLQKRVIDMIASYGYCSDKEYRIDITSDGQVRDWIDGDFSGGNFAKRFGLPSGIFYKKYPTTLFAKADFESSQFADNVQARNWRFTSTLKGYRTGGGAFAKCAGAIASRNATADYFNFKCPKQNVSSAVGIKANNRLRAVMAKACQVSPKIEKPRKCRKECERTSLFPIRITSQPNCTREGGGGNGNPPKPGCEECGNDRTPPGGGEPDKDRGSKQQEHDNDRGARGVSSVESK